MTSFRFPLIFSLMFCVHQMHAQYPYTAPDKNVRQKTFAEEMGNIHDGQHKWYPSSTTRSYKAGDADDSAKATKNPEAPAEKPKSLIDHPQQYGLLQELMEMLACPSKEMIKAEAGDSNETITWYIKSRVQKYARAYLKANTPEEPLSERAFLELLNSSLGESYLGEKPLSEEEKKNQSEKEVDEDKKAKQLSANSQLAAYLKEVFKKLEHEKLHGKLKIEDVGIAASDENREEEIKLFVQKTMGDINDKDPARTILKRLEKELKAIWGGNAKMCDAIPKFETEATKPVKTEEAKKPTADKEKSTKQTIGDLDQAVKKADSHEKLSKASADVKSLREKTESSIKELDTKIKDMSWSSPIQKLALLNQRAELKKLLSADGEIARLEADINTRKTLTPGGTDPNTPAAAKSSSYIVEEKALDLIQRKVDADNKVRQSEAKILSLTNSINDSLGTYFGATDIVNSKSTLLQRAKSPAATIELESKIDALKTERENLSKNIVSRAREQQESQSAIDGLDPTQRTAAERVARDLAYHAENYATFQASQGSSVAEAKAKVESADKALRAAKANKNPSIADENDKNIQVALLDLQKAQDLFAKASKATAAHSYRENLQSDLIRATPKSTFELNYTSHLNAIKPMSIGDLEKALKKVTDEENKLKQNAPTALSSTELVEMRQNIIKEIDRKRWLVLQVQKFK